MSDLGCQIANTNPALIMNSRSEYIRPDIQRMTHTDLIDDGAGASVGANRGRRPGGST